MIFKKNRKKNKKQRAKLLQIGSGTLALYMFLTSVFFFVPLMKSYALTGGPSQPEVQSFEPIGTSDMVNLFSGDFTYNIPLLDVEGYPINLSYNSGITTDQEASWTGLGWNVNVGTVNRALRGLPDDFNGDIITTESNIKPNTTVGVDVSAGEIEIFGLDSKKLGLSLSGNLGVNYNNYNGYGVSIGFGFDVSTKLGDYGKGTAGLGLNSSSSGGLNIQPSLSIQKKFKKDAEHRSIRGSIGSAFNSREGLSSLTIGSSLSKKFDIDTDNERSSGVGPSASFNFMQPAYPNSLSNNMSIFGISARLKGSVAISGTDVGGAFEISYSREKLKDPYVESKSYGYMYSHEGQDDVTALHDFSREGEGSVMPNTPNLARTNYTYDIYGVTGQGVGGSYRGFRGQLGHVYDNYNSMSSNEVPFTVELGAGFFAHAGSNAGYNSIRANSGVWKYDSDNSTRIGSGAKNYAQQVFNFDNKSNSPDFENVSFQEANEMSVMANEDLYENIGTNRAVRFEIGEGKKFARPLLSKLAPTGKNLTINESVKNNREKRNSTIQRLSIGAVKQGFGVDNLHASSYALNDAPNHHIGQIISLGTDGMRYVYGLPAYNKEQCDVTFAVNGSSADYNTGLVNYTPGLENSVDNDKGKDNFYQKRTTPAYAHSYMLTSIVSSDYVDADGTKGPSEGDLGSYTKFSYLANTDYKWRVPVEENKASFNEGLKTELADDKGSYIYGEKELWYLEKIETKNFIAIFTTSDRSDAKGVNGENGGVNNASSMRQLDNIKLFSKPDYEANGLSGTVLKEVHFEYDYELCEGSTNSNATNNGKLTLKKVYFTYRDSKKGKLSPYVFTYSAENPNYNLKAYDRWGNYKPNNATSSSVLSSPLPTYEFPYVNQDNSTTDQYVSSWTLTSIKLPSGGKIEVSLESDDYQYVQNKKAMEMFMIVGVGTDINGNGMLNNLSSIYTVQEISTDANKNRRIYIKKPTAVTMQELCGKLKATQEFVYTRCLMQVSGGSSKSYDYVPNYSQISDYGEDPNGDNELGWIEFKPVSFSDNGSDIYNPLTYTAIQFAKLYLSSYAWDTGGQNMPNGPSGVNLGFIKSLVSAAKGFVQGFQNPNKTLWNNSVGTELVTNKSWIRLPSPDKKLGGGVRVSKIAMIDNWSTMTNSVMSDFDYGQEYTYTLENGTSSGVAAYEPMLGGDENPFRAPIFFTQEKKMAPDNRFFQEEPIGESFFPSASVGYSRVVVKNLQRTGVSRNATGKVVHEFYTARDFPTVKNKTDISKINDKTPIGSFNSLFNVEAKDYLTASQGFVVETNDMHGKPKGQKVYAENKTDPITSVSYNYKLNSGLKSSEDAITASSFTPILNNKVKVVNKDGSVEEKTVGIKYDIIADFSENYTSTRNSRLNLNLDMIPIAFLPAPIPTGLPSYTSNKMLMRTATLTKVVQRFGILESTVARDLGSEVETRNLAYDAETGEVLLTETVTNFNDKVYSLNFPAYWFYDLMGPAYKNINHKTNITIASGFINNPASGLLVQGDEIMLTGPGLNVPTKGWVTDYDPSSNKLKIELYTGAPPPDGLYSALVLRSGRRNMQSQMMASITTRVNPLSNIANNVYEKVLQASAIEFSDSWRTYCNCNGESIESSTNPYFLGNKGNYKPKVSYLHLSERTQTDNEGNSNVRQDGVFQSFTPYYKLDDNSKWTVDRENWTYTAEVTEFNPFGQELENQDALGRSSSAQFGFNQTLAKSVAANTRYKNMGFSSFEDDDFSECADNHFNFGESNLRTEEKAHSGRYSIKVSPTSSATLSRDLAWCDKPDCNLSIQTRTTESNVEMEFLNAADPVSLDYEIIQGNPVISPLKDGLSAGLSGTYKLKVTIQDFDGCQDVKYITVINGKLQ